MPPQMRVRRANQYNLAPVSGAFGTALGDLIKVDFYFDSTEQAETIALKQVPGPVKNSTRLVPESGEPAIVREVMFGATLTPEAALVIGAWLCGKALGREQDDVLKNLATVFPDEFTVGGRP